MAYPAASGPVYDDGTADTSLLNALLGWLGAGLSLALVGGLIWWAYDIAVRDTRAIPVVRAMEGPARVAPDDPGGFQAPHTGYAVNAIAGEADRAPVAEQVALAPAPVTITKDDAPALRPGSQPATEVIRSSVDRAVMDALGIEPAAEGAETSVPADTTGAIRRPQLRPAVGAEVSRVSATAALPVAAAVAVSAGPGSPLSADEVPAGTRLVQLGAFPDEASAQSAWSNLSSGYAEYFDGKRPIYEQTEAAGLSLVRLRAHGFENRAEARRFCEVLLAGQAECIPVLTR